MSSVPLLARWCPAKDEAAGFEEGFTRTNELTILDKNDALYICFVRVKRSRNWSVRTGVLECVVSCICNLSRSCYTLNVLLTSTDFSSSIICVATSKEIMLA